MSNDGQKYSWLDGRSMCNEYCMDLVTLDSQEENDFIVGIVSTKNAMNVWTSGRLCDFEGCESRIDLNPSDPFGWFWWYATGKKIENA